jgi:uncharacterized protein (TIGR03083 family)
VIMPPHAMAAALDSAYRGFTAVVAPLRDAELSLPSGCRGWTIADLTVHLTQDAQRALVTLATPAAGSPDVDFVTYWRDFPGDDPSVGSGHARWVRRVAAAFDRPTDVVDVWTGLSEAAVRAATVADPDAPVSTQGHVLTVADLLATLVTEAVIHHLDAVVSLPEAPEPGPDTTAIAKSTVDHLFGPPGLPSTWSAAEALRKATGRSPLTAADRESLGAGADRLPVLG